MLATGGAGFVGSHLIDKVSAERYVITVLDSLIIITKKVLTYGLNV